MKINITDTFTKSLKRLVMHQSWWYKTYSFLRRDMWRFFSNIWKFRKELYEHRWWDYHFTLEIMERSLIIMEDGMSNKGLEVRETREPKVKAIRRVVELLQNRREDNYTERAQAELGPLVMHEWEFEEVPDNPNLSRLVDKDTPEEKEHNRLVFDRATEIENAEWIELWEIFKGTENSKKYDTKYDGTDMRCWWD
jgi:hypothetical protein